MANYDSDSSLSDAEFDGSSNADYIRTSVLLGYATKELAGDAFSQLGGEPVCSFRNTG